MTDALCFYIGETNRMTVSVLQEPDLNKMWRTWIKIQSGNQPTPKMFQDAIRQRMQPILQLQKSGEIAWFYFTWHTENAPDLANLYFDVVFTTERKEPDEFLPGYCTKAKKIDPMKSIAGIEEKFLEGEDIRKAWKIIGEQSEFIINLVCSHKKETEIPPRQIMQFMHFFMNQMGYGHKSLFFPKGHPDRIAQVVSQVVHFLGGEMIRF